MPNSERLSRFTGLLKQIFELDKSELDFGIYRILNIRKEQISKFLETGLPQKAREILTPFADSEKAEIQAKIDELKAQAAKFNADVEQNEEYQALQTRLQSATDLAVLENDVYSYLYNFFSRYYDEGDFISKRRYKEGVYAIPYEGEEVKLYWANQDQYYIKTTENFKDYSFVSGGVAVHFLLTDATTEQNNNKEAGDKKRVFMLLTGNDEQKAIEVQTSNNTNERELIIRFVYDVSSESQKVWNERNYKTITEFIYKGHKDLNFLIKPPEKPKDPKDAKAILEKHLLAYIAKNTFDYFIHKDLGGFLRRELDFYIKNEIIHLDDIDTDEEQQVEKYLAKVRAVKRVGGIIIDFLAQIENFQKKLYLKKKFVARTDWCITLDRVPEDFYEEVRNNKEQVREWIELFGMGNGEQGTGNRVGNGELGTGNGELGFGERWTDPPSVKFLRENKNLVIDTRHFPSGFKDKLIAGIDNLDDAVDGVLIHSENFQALNLLRERYRGQVSTVHIDPPYNTDASGFLYKNNYRNSSWASMMFDRILLAEDMLKFDVGDFQCHIDENEYELLYFIFNLFNRGNAGTIVWNKMNPMMGRQGIATQHEYIIYRNNCDTPVNVNSTNIKNIKQYAETAIKQSGGKINELSRRLFAEMVSKDTDLTGGEKQYHFIDDDGRIYRLVAMSWPNQIPPPEQFFIPLIHPVTKKPCPVPSRGWSRSPETMKKLIEEGLIVFGSDETTQPQKKVYISEDSKKQISSVLSEGKTGKADLDNLGFYFPYAHPVSMYETLLSANDSNLILDYFAGSGTTGHAVINLNRQDQETLRNSAPSAVNQSPQRKYILVEMGEYFNTVTKPRMQKVIYAKDWKDGKPLSRNTGVSQLMKYFSLESYEDTLNNIWFDPKDKSEKALAFGDDYLVRYMLDTETSGSLLNIDKFKDPFKYTLNITEKNEIKETPVDLPETFNYLLGITVRRQGALTFYKAKKNGDKEYEGSVDLAADKRGNYGFKEIEGSLPDGSRALVIWRTITENINDSNAALDAYFLKNRANPGDRDFSRIYVNGDNNLENLRTPDETWKVNLIEKEFLERMFEGE